MTDVGKYARWLLTAAVTGAFVFNAGIASAKLDLCQQDIEVQATLFHNAISTAMQSCKNAVRKEQVKNSAKAGTGFLGTAAKTCELAFAKVYGMAGGPKPFTGKTAVTKFREQWVKFRTGKCKVGGAPCTSNASCGANGPCSAPCTDEDLTTGTGIGHLLSGPTGAAPPSVGDAGKFACDWIMIAKEKLAIKQQLFLIPDTIQLLLAAIGAPAEGVNTSGVASKKGTNCSATFNANLEEYRPNLCRFGIECRDHACQLDPATSQANLISAPLNGLIGPQTLPLTGRNTLEMCTLGSSAVNPGVCFDAPNGPCATDADCPVSGTNHCSFSPQEGLGGQFGAETGFMYLINEPSRALKVTVPGALAGLGVEAICVDGVRSEGWCDCTGHGLLKNTDFCIDQTTTGNVTNDDCGSPITAAVDSPLYKGTKNGALKITPSGASVAGDCFDLQTTQFKIPMTGQAGADGKDCTNDDFVAPSAPAALPITTGQAHAAVKDAVASAGSCDTALNASAGSRDCQDLVNCNYCSLSLSTWCDPTHPCLPAQGTCTTDTGCSPATLVNISSATLTGAVGGGCAAYQTSDQSGLKFVGAFPAINGAPPLGDSVTAFTIKCQ